MTGRGESHFAELPGFAARLYEWLTSSEGTRRYLHEIALDLSSRVPEGALLDVGTGPGKLLDDLARLNPALRLHGLDISEAMVRRARSNLAHLGVDLRVGCIQSTNYPDGFFDGVACSGSFYLWDEPVPGLDEIHRILVPGGAAHLYESCRDCDLAVVDRAIRENLRHDLLVRRLVSPHFMKRQLSMTYSEAEMVEIVRGSRFADTFTVERITLAGIPAWVRISMMKS